MDVALYIKNDKVVRGNYKHTRRAWDITREELLVDQLEKIEIMRKAKEAVELPILLSLHFIGRQVVALYFKINDVTLTER